MASELTERYGGIGNIQTEAQLERFVQARTEPLMLAIRHLQGAVRRGTGSPEGVVDAPRGVVFERSDGGAGTSVYIKESAAGTLTGWAPK